MTGKSNWILFFEKETGKVLVVSSLRFALSMKFAHSPPAVSTQDFRDVGFAKLDHDLAFLMEALREVLVELGEKDVADQLPWSSKSRPAGKPDRFSKKLGEACSIGFHLLNMVEENVAAQMRRARAAAGTARMEPGLWADQLLRLKEEGCKPAEIAAQLSRIRIEPVLTAHPTEAKRSTVLEMHRELYVLLVQLENQMWTPAEKEAIRDQIKVALERLWRTGEVLLQKPEVSKERTTLMYYLREVFPAVLPRLDLNLRQAWKTAGFDPRLIAGPGKMPKPCFGSWVGGDRDGHPFVTAQVTEASLMEMREQALLVLHRMLEKLPRHLSLSALEHDVPNNFTQAIRKMAKKLGERGAKAVERNPLEPWRQYVSLVLLRMPVVLNQRQRLEFREHPGAYERPEELAADLKVLHQSLVRIGAGRLAEAEVDPILRAVSVFGFHLACLDIRQNSAFHDKALAQLMGSAGLDGADFAEWSEAERVHFLEKELRSPRPFLHAQAPVGPEATAVLECYRVLAQHIEKYGRGGLGSLIVSMTRRYSDLLVVYVLAREAGLAAFHSGHLVCQLPVVPLFETLDDLEASPAILRNFLEHPVTRASMKLQQLGRSKPVQQIMIGYSDSNKDVGILASQWALHQAQTALVATAEDCGYALRFFHGRGGTISRGAGPTHRFLEALPHGSLQGDLRVTEQGETIAQKYANLITATYNLELLLAGVTAVTLRHRKGQPEVPGAKIVGFLARASSECYRGLLSRDGFMDFYTQATPLDALENSRIGSRPSRRTGSRTLADLRAIPWVFSWTQSRYYLPGWFGVGTALERLQKEDPEGFASLKGLVKTWPFLRYVLTNVETNLASADLSIMKDYAGLVRQPELRKSFYGEISSEYLRARKMLDLIFGGKTVEQRRPRMLKTLGLRDAPLRVLHRQQVELLHRWRQLREKDRQKEANAMLPDLLLSINAIASGLRTTG
jgi:phosphoenolpyruvate carboxylase